MSATATVTRYEHLILKELGETQTLLHILDTQRAHNSDGLGDIVDQANHMVNMAINLEFRRMNQLRREQLERARDRLLSGQYGICESCGNQINPDRLEIVPYTTLCVMCQRNSGK